MIKPKLKLCGGCYFPKHIWKNQDGKKLCRDCYGKSLTGVAKKSKPTKARPIPVRSSKRAKLDAVYSSMRVIFLTAHPMCHAHIDAKCTQKSSEVHHKCGRIGEFYLDTRYWLPTCHSCHVWIEKNVEKSKEMGLSVDRLTLETNEEKDT